MRFFSIFLIVVLFTGCHHKKKVHKNTDNNTTEKNITEKNVTESNQSNIEKNKTLPPLPKVIESDSNIKNIIIQDLVFIKRNDKLYFSFKHTKLLVFLNDNTYSKLEKKELKKLKSHYYIIKNKDLIQFFNIKKYPSIVILKHKTAKKYEGFMPYEILKYEIKD